MHFLLVVITMSQKCMSWMALWKVFCLPGFVLIPTKDFWILFMLSVSFFLFCAIWIFYPIYSRLRTGSNLTEFILFVTTESAVVAQVVSCYEGGHGWKRCQREIFFLLFPFLICPIWYWFALLRTSLLPHRPELISSALRGCSEAAVSCVYLWVVVFFFFLISFTVLEEHRLGP